MAKFGCLMYICPKAFAQGIQVPVSAMAIHIRWEGGPGTAPRSLDQSAGDSDSLCAGVLGTRGTRGFTWRDFCCIRRFMRFMRLPEQTLSQFLIHGFRSLSEGRFAALASGLCTLDRWLSLEGVWYHMIKVPRCGLACLCCSTVHECFLHLHARHSTQLRPSSRPRQFDMIEYASTIPTHRLQSVHPRQL